MKLAKQQCRSCPFLSGGLPLDFDVLVGIYANSLIGFDHVCHSSNYPNEVLCLGAKKWIKTLSEISKTTV